MDDVLGTASRLVLIAVDTSEPGNAGTLIRIADAMGADAVVFAGDECRPVQRQVPAGVGGQHLRAAGAVRARHRRH